MRDDVEVGSEVDTGLGMGDGQMFLRILAAVILGGALGTGAAFTVVQTQSHSTNHITQSVQQYGDRS